MHSLFHCFKSRSALFPVIAPCGVVNVCIIRNTQEALFRGFMTSTMHSQSVTLVTTTPRRAEDVFFAPPGKTPHRRAGNTAQGYEKIRSCTPQSTQFKLLTALTVLASVTENFFSKYQAHRASN